AVGLFIIQRSIYDYPYRKQIINLLKGDILFFHLIINGKYGLRPSLYAVTIFLLIQLIFKGSYKTLNKLVSGKAGFADLVDYKIIGISIHKFQVQVLQF